MERAGGKAHRKENINAMIKLATPTPHGPSDNNLAVY
jgi:hypothetical protein